MKKFRLSAYITMFVSLMISMVSGYCTVIGMGKVFASAAMVTMFISAVIEVGRVILLYDLHHYWEVMKFKQKLPGVLMLLIAMTLSAMGVYGFFANAHSQRTQEIIPINLEISQKEQEIEIINQSIEDDNKQLNQYSNKATEKLTEMGYVTKALNAQKEQIKATKEIYDSIKSKQEQITNIKKEILNLKLDAEKKAPTLAHLKYYAKLFNVDDDMAIIIFIVMIMLVFDTLAMYLMITADWITKLDNKEVKIKDLPISELSKLESTLQNFQINHDYEPVDYQKIEEIISKYKPDDSDKFNQIINKINDDKETLNNHSKYLTDNILNLNDKFDDLKDNILSANNLTQHLIEEKYDNYVGNINDLSEHIDKLKNTNLDDRLNEIEDRLKTITANEKNKTQKIIDSKFEKVIQLIQDDESIIDSKSFKDYIMNNSFLIEKLKKHFINNKTITKKLTQL